MKRIINTKTILISLLFCAIYACIDQFTPDVGEGKELLVINGTVTDEEGYQYAEISTTSPFNNPEYNPLDECQVKIIDVSGNEFDMERYAAGKYRTWIDEQYLQTGNLFKIEVVLDNGEGKRYESEFDTLLPCPDIDEIYFESTKVIPDDPNLTAKDGIQFYIDFDATGDFASNFRWEAVETWEYKAEEKTYIIYYGIANVCCNSNEEYPLYHPCYEINSDTCWNWLDLTFLNPESRDDQYLINRLYTCWKTENTKGIFTYTSHQKANKKVTGLPLYLVTNRDNRLTVKYSILIKQFALSDEAFLYWNQLQTLSQESGGLYDTQPYELKGNIRCMDDEDETVIGFFSASTVKTKRFTTPIYMARNNYRCIEIVEEWENVLKLLWGGIIGQPPSSNSDIPDTLYLTPFFKEGKPRTDTFALRDQSCIDCRLKGGKLTKPDYW
jgi:hypothetical protein